MENDCNLDVFGGEHFENNSTLLKIGGSSFVDANILAIKEIPGFAFEDNANALLERETVVMFGYSVLVSVGDLNKIENTVHGSKICLWSLLDDPPPNLTAKAELAFKVAAKSTAKRRRGVPGL